MVTRRKRHKRESQAQLPTRLASDLARLYEPPGPIPPEVDAAITEDAERMLETIRQQRRIRRWGQLAVAAAAIVLMVWLYEIARTPAPSPLAPPPLAGVRDIDRSGRIDILDAFALARRVESGDALERQWDFNHDGIVDRNDVDVIAMTAVRLDRGAS